MAVFIINYVVGRFTAPITTKICGRKYATKLEKKRGIDKKQGPKIDSSMESLKTKGFLRAQKSYIPPENVTEKLDQIFQSIFGKDAKDLTKINDLNKKFQLCTSCERELNHTIPNSLLHTLNTLGDIRHFYQTQIDTTTPLDKMRNMNLPENLHVQFEYHRFHPDTDTKFGGKTAFNESSTLVTGLKYKNKYQGHIQKQKWPFKL